MSQDKCNHFEHGGDFVNGWWICAKCFEKLQRRPVRYYTLRMGDDIYGDFSATHPQESIESSIAECRGVTLSEFIGFMSLRLISLTRGEMTKLDAASYSIDLLKDLGEPFGNKDYSWDRSGAHEIIAEDLQYWDEGDSGSNS